MTEAMKTEQQKRGIAITLGVIVAFIVVVMLLFINKITTPRVLSNLELQVHGTIVFEQPRIFKDLVLLDHKGEEFTKARFQGKWSFVFFGFTHCPDICPTTMAALSSWYKTLSPEVQQQTQIIMVSVDPARDSVEILAQYVPYFNADFIGLTGEFLPIKRFANQLNVAFTKVVQGDDYTVDHSGIIAMINPRGDYHAFIKPPLNAENASLTYSSIRNSFPSD
ncbi:SCO family protein [Simiduia litorea]|uniref:SCO family protein n=1 Tax=Simiduia litorea TaxID=1435348 RepID=UPI0036F32ADF